jgi:diguanylate cyclase (GGDEF)-like protein/PAS domain S-box-containing protein
MIKTFHKYVFQFFRHQKLFVIFMAVILVVGGVYINDTRNSYIKQAHHHGIMLVQSAEAFISDEMVNKLKAHPSDVGKSEYQQLKDSLIRLKQRDQHIRYAYLYTQRNGKRFFMVDSEMPGSDDYSAPGQEYTNIVKNGEHPFVDDRPIVSEPITGKSDRWISILAPIKDGSTGETIAVLGIDHSEKQLYKEVYKHVLHAFIVVVCICLLFIFIYRLMVKNRILSSVSNELKQSEELFRTIFQQAPVGLAIGRDYHYSSKINPMFQRILGRSLEELTAISWTDVTHPDDVQRDIENFTKLKTGEIDGYSMEKRYVKPDGSHVWVNMVVAPLHLSQQHLGKYLCIIQDITKRIEAEAALKESERSKALLLSHLPGMAYRCRFDREWTMEFVSEGCYALTGYQPESLLYNKELSYNDIIQPQFREILWKEWERAIQLKSDFQYEYQITTANGQQKWVLELGHGVYDESGNVEAIEGIIIDVTLQKKREEQIQYLNNHDLMTGVYNRHYFEQERERLQKPDFLPLSIIIGDINGLKLVNNAFGHLQVDSIIRKTAKILQSCCRDGDILARTGDDEFSILLPNTDADAVTEILEKIKNAFNLYNQSITNDMYRINLSLGYGTKETEKVDFGQIIARAQDHMYKNKLLNSKSSHSATLSAVMAALYERSEETEEHAERLVFLSKKIGVRLNLPQKSLDELELLAMLHDVGKVGIKDNILNKSGGLSHEEWDVMRRHPEIGYRIAMSSSELEPVAQYILTHHERWDGKGYPKGLKGREIPLPSRILAVVDAYDAMTEERVYRKPMTKEAALEEIQKNSGTQFDPEIVRVFMEII